MDIALEEFDYKQVSVDGYPINTKVRSLLEKDSTSLRISQSLTLVSGGVR